MYFYIFHRPNFRIKKQLMDIVFAWVKGSRNRNRRSIERLRQVEANLSVVMELEREWIVNGRPLVDGKYVRVERSD